MKKIYNLIKKNYYRMMDNIYLSRILLIIVFGMIGYISTFVKTDETKMCFTGMSMVGIVYGIGTIFISLREAKCHKKTFVVVLDLLLLSFLYASTYCSIYSWNNEAFLISHPNIIYFDFLYYSFITLTTTGYGDIVPVSYLAKFCSASESFVFACIISVVIMNFSKGLNNNI